MSQLANILSLTVLIFGVIALADFPANTRMRRVALVEMVLSIVGTALVLSIPGLRAYAMPAVGLAYSNGQEDARAIFDIIVGSPAARVIYVVVVGIYSAGFVLFGIAAWGFGVLLKGTVMSFPSRGMADAEFTNLRESWPPVETEQWRLL